MAVAGADVACLAIRAAHFAGQSGVLLVLAIGTVRHAIGCAEGQVVLDGVVDPASHAVLVSRLDALAAKIVAFLARVVVR